MARPERGPMMGGGWRLPALAVAAILVVLVAVGRMGMRSVPLPPSPRPTAAPTLAPVAVATPSLPPADSRPVPSFVRNASVFDYAYSRWPDRYADGIPRSIDGDKVVRLPAALDLAFFSGRGVTDRVLIGGWYAGPPDGASGCSELAYEPWCQGGRVADSVVDLSRGMGAHADQLLPRGAGPLVVNAVVHETCNPESPFGCDYTLAADEIVWQGDELTDTEPIAVGPLLIALVAALTFEPLPFHEHPECQLERPAQTYADTFGEVQWLFAFRSTAEREAMTTSVLNGPPFGDPANGCVQREPLDGVAGWISRDNVLLRVSDYAGPAGDKVRIILDELAASADGA